VAAPSANRFGAVSPTTAEAVGEELGNYFGSSDLVLDGGPCFIGIESTIIDCTGIVPRVLRPGTITQELIEQLTGIHEHPIEHNWKIKAPGLLKMHYAPKAQISFNSLVEPGDGFLAPANFPTPFGAVRLASPESSEQYANELYSALRSADNMGLKKIVVIAPEGPGLAEAIRDRLGRAVR